MRKSLSEHDLSRSEAYPEGDTARFDEGHARQDLVSDRCRATRVSRLNEKGFQTLTLFGLHTPAHLFDADPEGVKALAKERAIASLNEYLLDPIESVLAPCRDGSLAIEVKSPLDLEKDISLPRGNIFHRDLDFPFLDEEERAGDQQLWCAETDDPHIYIAGAGARRGGGVSGIAGHNAGMALLA